MKALRIFLVLFGALGFHQCLAQTDSLEMQHPLHGDYLRSYFSDTRALIAAPFSATGKAWRQAGWAGAAVGGGFLLDRSVFDRLPRWENTRSLPFQTAAAFGNGLVTLPATGIFWAIGYWKKDAHLAETGLLAAKTFILSRVLVQIPKYAFQRYRPLDALGNPLEFAGPFGGFVHDAFPSGHVTSAFATAAVMRVAFRHENRLIPVLFYGMGAITAAGRLAEGKHWFSDVVAGALFGHAVGHFLASRSSKLQATPGGLAYRF